MNARIWLCMVMWQRWRSHHSICHCRKPPCYKQTSWLCLIERVLLPMQVLDCGSRDFWLFCSCVLDLDCDLMTFIYELDPYSLQMYWMCKYEPPTSRPSKVIVLERDRHDWNYILFRFTGSQNYLSEWCYGKDILRAFNTVTEKMHPRCWRVDVKSLRL